MRIDQKEDLERIANECAYYYEVLLFNIIAFLMIITSPLWIAPYVLYWRRKHRNKKEVTNDVQHY